MKYLTSITTFFALALVCASSLYAQKESEVSWATLSDVQLVRGSLGYEPDFGQDVEELNGGLIKVTGYIMPLQQTGDQSHFILTQMPVGNCYFCTPGGPESMIEVKADTPVKFSYEQVTVVGKLELLRADAMGMYYRLTAAKPG